MIKEPDYYDIAGNTIKVVIETLVKKAGDLLEKSWTKKNSSKEVVPNKIDFESKILEHFSEIYTWSNHIEFIGLGKPLKTDEKTVNLDISYNVRRLTSKSPHDSLIEEKDLVIDSSHFIILGDPGSGKSTTLKRLITYFFFSNNLNSTLYNYPLLVKFREIKVFQNIYTHICDILGINYETREFTYEVNEDHEKIVRDENGQPIYILEERQDHRTGQKYSVRIPQIEIVTIKEQKKEFKYYIDGENIEIILAKIIEENKVLLVLDGLDETNYQISELIQKDLKSLASKLQVAKILITSRPDSLEQNFSEYSYVQICELNNNQIAEISQLWLENTDTFLSSLKDKSYFELARKPLFLCFLLLLFNVEESLPYSSKEVYSQIIHLLINKWDKERGIKRASNYAKFDTFKKVEFLTHLAFILTYNLKTKSFSQEDLENAYLRINDRFSLPAEESSSVCREVENHTGIIVKAFYDKYEFSHLAIQEYLCANYIINAAYSEKIYEYLKQSPAPVAMAISLSSESSVFLTKVILDFIIRQEKPFATRLAKTILRRLLIESPFFDEYESLGIAIMSMSTVCNCKDIEFVDLFTSFLLHHPNIYGSLNKALKYYVAFDEHHMFNQVYLKRESYFNLEGIPNTAFFSQLYLPLNLNHSLIHIPYPTTQIRKH